MDGSSPATLVAADEVPRGDNLLDVGAAGGRRLEAALFVGAGRYAPRTSTPVRRHRLTPGCLDVRHLEVEGRRPRLRPLARLARPRSGSWSPFERVELSELSPLTQLTVLVHGETLPARDGEVGPTSDTRVTFTIDAGALTVFAPFTVNGRHH